MLSIFETSYDQAPELVIGLIAPIGANLDLVVNTLTEELSQLRYRSEVVRVSSALHQLKKYEHLRQPGAGSEYSRIREHMKAGTDVRTHTGRGDIMALLAIGEIRRLRARKNGSEGVEDAKSVPRHRTAYVLRSLKHPDEIATLRDIYGSAFIAISVYAPRIERATSLAKTLSESARDFNPDKHLSEADELINIDEEEEGNKLGQDVSDAFPLGDLFVDARSKDRIHGQIARFLDGFFGHPFCSPTKDEFAMFFAKSAALRSADLARQVGAVIMSEDGELLSAGCNDVPKSGGGLYWVSDANDNRDFVVGYDSSAKFKNDILGELLKKLKDSGWLEKSKESLDVASLVEEAKKDKQLSLKDSQIMNVIEYGRSVHAEMAALSDAAKRGVSIKGATLYCTTFPCHLCARHIVAAGLRRVVYIEPYPKSQTKRLYWDSIEIDPASPVANKVAFEPFVGVAPRKFYEMFELKRERKDRSGVAVPWVRAEASPHIKRFVLTYLLAEEAIIAGDLSSALSSAKLDVSGRPET